MKFIRNEWVLFIGLLTVLFFKTIGNDLLLGSSSSFLYWSSAGFLFIIVMLSIFGVVKHSDALAINLGDPLGTLILTLSVISLEVIMISSVMLTGDSNPVLARDTMFAVIMSILNGLVGVALLIGGHKYHIQKYNIQGINSYLVAIVPLTILCLILPNFTSKNEFGEMSFILASALVVISIILYGIFLYVQTKSHSYFFIDEDNDHTDEHHSILGSNTYHFLLLFGYLIVVIFLAKSIAIPIDASIGHLGAPAALGGLVVALLVLAPEGVGAIKASLNNQLQRAMNLFFGSILATISLTVPAVIIISNIIGEPIILGLEPAQMILLIASLMVASISFRHGKTNILNGITHLFLFFIYLVLIFD
ncbi:calcium:proton antiporter [Vibrio sp. 11986-1-5]|uniref:calcium:proton antiporter n=2 Tax=Vibrionaceae TaxID=641 RepID=UPI000D729407|nr:MULTISPECIES: calcium:proton antiporter [Vibrio]PXA73005.1 calcium:proton antiporter [Vibrio sp. 11986-1-5]